MCWDTDKNKSVLSFPPSLAVNITLLNLLLSASACRMAPAAADRYILSAGHSAANQPATVALVDRWDRRTEEGTALTAIRTDC